MVTLTPDELAKLKKYIRIDYDDDDPLLETFYKQAGIHIRNQVGAIDETNENMLEQYNQARALLVQHWNDNRQSFRSDKDYEVPHSLNSIVLHLKYCYPVGDQV
ncbi:head-tail connector protein [Halolactibacillus sp. JCM 19043]|uniref:head-tail connector protein n=1 Tax=Halolactibacillus sp. JCM 19043 TaxID=1460638 RepID=UPI0007864417|nr:head-tail connector protein [Halolactibacillus sp. JCM 19043]